jgi:hypothetical protein
LRFADELKKLVELKDIGALTQDEFDAAKAEIFAPPTKVSSFHQQL